MMSPVLMSRTLILDPNKIKRGKRQSDGIKENSAKSFTASRAEDEPKSADVAGSKWRDADGRANILRLFNQ